jgi:hypothetical protein
MTEAAVAVAGIILCWLIAVVTYEDSMSLTRYAVVALLSVMAAYFAVFVTFESAVKLMRMIQLFPASRVFGQSSAPRKPTNHHLRSERR